MRIAVRRGKSGRTIVQDAADASSEVALAEISQELAEAGVEIAGETIGLGLVKRLGESLFRIGRIIGDRVNDAQDALQESERQAVRVSNEVLADLDTLLNPSSRHYARRPAVILIDDAQYADHDKPIAAFLEQLIYKSAQGRWPLLIVLTHWSRQLSVWRDAEGRRHQESYVANVLNHARHSAQRDEGVFAEQLGGSLDKSNYIEIDLGEPVTDLSPALYGRFPGIDQETAGEIVELSGGNPRKLEQVVETIERKPRWFENHNLAANLTEEGRAQALSVSQLPIDDIVYDRLKDTPPLVRRSLALASTVGSPFLVELIDRLALAKLADSARQHLEAGEDRYRFLKYVGDRSRSDLGQFAEPLFLSAAREYRANAKADFGDWPPDEELFDTLDQFLDELIDDPTVFEGLTDEDLGHAFLVAVGRMMDRGSSKAGLALARLVHLENRRGNFDGACEAADRFIAGFRA